MLHAVIVGIDHYSDQRVGDLRYARADAEAVCKLVSRVDSTELNVRLILDEEATRKNIMSAIGEDVARAAAPDDLVLLYFAGHGAPETDSNVDQVSRYLVTHDADYESIYSTGIDLEADLVRWLERLKNCKLVIILLDVCFSGIAGGRTFEGPRLRSLRSGSRGAGPITLKNLELGEGRLIITACGDAEVAMEQQSLGHGVFTHFLLAGPDLVPVPLDNRVSVTKVYDALSLSVRGHTRGRQTPVLNGRSSFARLPYFWAT